MRSSSTRPSACQRRLAALLCRWQACIVAALVSLVFWSIIDRHLHSRKARSQQGAAWPSGRRRGGGHRQRRLCDTCVGQGSMDGMRIPMDGMRRSQWDSMHMRHGAQTGRAWPRRRQPGCAPGSPVPAGLAASGPPQSAAAHALATQFPRFSSCAHCIHSLFFFYSFDVARGLACLRSYWSLVRMGIAPHPMPI